MYLYKPYDYVLYPPNMRANCHQLYELGNANKYDYMNTII